MLKSFKQIWKFSVVCSLLTFYKTNTDDIRSVFIRNVKVKEDKMFNGLRFYMFERRRKKQQKFLYKTCQKYLNIQNVFRVNLNSRCNLWYTKGNMKGIWNLHGLSITYRLLKNVKQTRYNFRTHLVLHLHV